MRRDYRPIIITLAHPGNHGGSSYLLESAEKNLNGGRGIDSHKIYIYIYSAERDLPYLLPMCGNAAAKH